MFHSDRITIRGLSVLANVGIMPHELEAPQWIELTITYQVNAEDVAQTDDIAATVSYADVREHIIHFLKTQRFNLLETLAHQLALDLKTTFHLPAVELSVCKPEIFDDANGVLVSVSR